MQVIRTNPSDTEVTLEIKADAAELQTIKNQVVKRLAKRVNLPGFRSGKAPLPLIEKQLDPNLLHTEFLDEALNHLYTSALRQEQLRPMAQPKVEIKKFVPFETLEAVIQTEIIGPIKLGDYKKIKKSREPVKIDSTEVDKVIKSLQIRMAERKDVDRAAKEGDQAWIDFSGVNDKGEPVQGADGKDYPLVIGSDTFIKGFEPEIIGLKAGDTKTFTVVFPKDYGVKALQDRKVTFTVKVNRVQEVIEPTVDDAFAKQVGPFEDLKQLKADIRQQLQAEREVERDRAIENEIIEELVEKSTVAIPQALITMQIDRSTEEERRSLTYKGITWEEHLKEEGMTEEEHREKRMRPEAERRIKTGLVLAQVAEEEGLRVSQEELVARLQQLKQQYHSDPQMQKELDNPDNHQDIAARILTEKTVALLLERSQQK